MDENLRDLRRQAAQDPKAAIAYYHALKRKGLLLQPEVPIPSQTVELNARGISGLISLHPVSGTEIVVSSFVDRQNVITTINRIDYQIRGRYYFYPELGWVPYDPEIISHAQEHANRVKEYSQLHEEDDLRRERETLRYWLPPRSHIEDGNCFSCGSPHSQTVHLVLRTGDSARGTVAAYNRLDAYLRSLLPEWVNDHQEIMRIAQLNEIQRHKKSVDEKLTELYDKVATLQQQMVELISEEIQLD